MADEAPGASKQSAPQGHREEPLPSGLLRLAVSGLDLLIAAYAVGLSLLALTGGVDLGVVSIHGAAKPLLMLVLLVPLRIAVGGRSWLADLTPALVFLALTPVIFRRLGMAMGAYVLVSLLLPLSSNELEGIGRYAAVLFPAFMLVGSMASPRVHQAIVMVSLVFHTLFVCFFVTWKPIY